MGLSITLSGLAIMLVTRLLGDAPFGDEQIKNFVDIAGFLIGLIVAYFGRLRVGDITWYGTRKK